MRREFLIRVSHCLAFLALWALSPVELRGEDDVSEAEKLFALKVQPLFRAKCLGCHGDDPEKIESGFDMRGRKTTLAGGELFGEDVLKPGAAAESQLMAMINRTEEGLEMPPKAADKLTQEQVWSVRDWINGGAPWPDAERVAEIYRRFAEGVVVKTSGGLSSDWTDRKYKTENLWAYRRVERTDVPDKTHPVDFFIERKLGELKIQPAGLADRRTLIRRATFDLLGLPPTPKEVRQFLDDPLDDVAAFRALVDRLLARPQYGEQWGRHWLDVVRYADSSGFANDWERPNAWRYRDYVIRALNQDKPYDQFVREQLAGDELDPQSSENAIAVGFLRMGPWEHTGMSVARVTRQQFLDDVTDAVGQVFLAHALQCCRCHDHKFDPIPTRDYYSFQAVFATTQFADVDAKWLPSENRTGMQSDRAYLQKKINANNQVFAQLAESKRVFEQEWFKKRGLPYKTRQEAVRAKVPADQLPPRRQELKTPDDFGRERIARKWRARFPWEMDRYKEIAFSVYSGKTRPPGSASSRAIKPADPMGKGRLEQTSILKGGDPFAPSDAVKPGAISAVPGGLNAKIPSTAAGRRMALAEWITRPDNSLTARVMVNRIWLYHFGRGIAGNPNNFGSTGKKPTHPELLDWLASEFVRQGWSVKAMHRLIMSSDAYRRASSHPDPKQLEALEAPEEAYAVYQPRRLSAEEIRDAMLAASGELNSQVGGIPARPDMNLEAALQPRMIMGTFAPSYVPDPKPQQRNRRSVYALKLRGHRDPFLETFNQPGSEKSCELRDSSTVTPQALTLLNSEESSDRALALAHRLTQSHPKNDAKAISDLYMLAYGRPATPQEVRVALSHWSQMRALHKDRKTTPRKWPTTVVRRANEENTGEPFTFTEQLFAYEDYEPDLQTHQVDVRTVALADLCLAVLNSNEFVYVY